MLTLRHLQEDFVMTHLRKTIGVGVLLCGISSGGMLMAQESRPTGTTRSAQQPPVERCVVNMVRVNRRECRSGVMQVKICKRGAVPVSQTPVTCIG